MNDRLVSNMLQFIESCEDPHKLRTIAENAKLKSEDVFRAAKLRLYDVLPSERPGTLEHDVWRAIHALEDALTDERGKTTRLSRTRQKIARQDERSCVADLVLGSPSEGFRMLAARNMLDLSFEAVALRHPAVFSEEVLTAARERLAEAGLEVQ